MRCHRSTLRHRRDGRIRVRPPCGRTLTSAAPSIQGEHLQRAQGRAGTLLVQRAQRALVRLGERGLVSQRAEQRLVREHREGLVALPCGQLPQVVREPVGDRELLAAGGTFRRLLAQLDRRSDVAAYPLYAPLLVDRVETADDLRRQPVIAAALQMAGALDVAVVAIGAWKAGESAVWDRTSPSLRAACADAGAVAEFSGLFVGADGETVSTPLNRRVIGVTMEQLRSAQTVIGFAAGAARADAVRAAARTACSPRSSSTPSSPTRSPAADSRSQIAGVTASRGRPSMRPRRRRTTRQL